MEADIFSLDNPRDADLIDGSIGERSLFHQTFGYYAHGVGVLRHTPLDDARRDACNARLQRLSRPSE